MCFLDNTLSNVECKLKNLIIYSRMLQIVYKVIVLYNNLIGETQVNFYSMVKILPDDNIQFYKWLIIGNKQFLCQK